jgi:hypothetical protein
MLWGFLAATAVTDPPAALRADLQYRAGVNYDIFTANDAPR